MQLRGVTYRGAPPDDDEVLERLPAPLATLLRQVNGFVQLEGGLHVRGAVREPAWHSLREAWLGDRALHRAYSVVDPGDVPFAQDCVGDQFLLGLAPGDEGAVWKLRAEEGRVERVANALGTFLRAVEDEPLETLELHPLLEFRRTGGHLSPGELLSVFPPFCTAEAQGGVSLRAIDARERLEFLADFSARVEHAPESARLRVRVRMRDEGG